MHVLCGRCVCMFVVGKRLSHAGGVRDRFMARRCLCKKLCVWCMNICMCEKSFCCCLGRRGAWMFAEMLIHFRFGKFFHHPYVIVLGEVMPNFSGDHAYACMLRY